MRKYIVLLLVLGVCATVMAKDDHFTTGNATAVTGTWTAFYADSFVLDTTNTPYRIKFPTPVYNFTIREISTDSSYIIVYLDNGPIYGVYNDVSTPSSNWQWNLGDSTGTDTLSLFMGITDVLIDYFPYYDSNGVVVEVEAQR